MSAARSIFSSQGPFQCLAGVRMSAPDYLAMGETREHYELVHGVVLMSPSPRPRHWKVLHELLRQLDRYEESGGKIDVYCETDLRLSDTCVFRPDLCVYARSGSAVDIPERLTSPPDLIVEVSSPGSEAFDLITKKDEYERFGVGEYWVIDPASAELRSWHREGERLVEASIDIDRHTSAILVGFVLDRARLAAATGNSRKFQ